MSHYYTDNHNLPSDRKEISFRFSGLDYTFITDIGVFSKSGVDYGTRVLLESIPQLKGTLLDVGCGYGVISVVCAKTFGVDVTGVDVNSRAVELTLANAEKNGVAVKAMVSDGYEKVDGCFDTILTNPPIRAGKQVVHAILEGAYAHLNVGGCLYAVIRKQQGAPSAKKKIEEVFGQCEVISKDAGYWILKAEKC